MNEKFQEAQAQWKSFVSSLVSGGFYKNTKKAESYFTSHIFPTWSIVLDLDGDGDDVIRALGLTPTMLQMLHLFGRGYAGVGATKKTPRFAAWPPLLDRDTGSMRFIHAAPKSDIAKIIGKSKSAVDEACDRFRGKGKSGDALFDRRLATILSVETGIMLDGMFTPQTSFAFMHEDYEHANQYAQSQGDAIAKTFARQKKWAAEGKAHGLQLNIIDTSLVRPAEPTPVAV